MADVATDDWYDEVVRMADTLPADDAIAWLAASIAETGGKHPMLADLAWRLGLAHSDGRTGHARHFLHLASELATGSFKDIVLLDLFIDGLVAGEVDDETWDNIGNPFAIGAVTPWGPGETVSWPAFRTEGNPLTALGGFVRAMRPAIRKEGLVCHGVLLSGYRALTWLIEEEHDSERLMEDWLHGLIRVRIERDDDDLIGLLTAVSGQLAEPEPFNEAVRALWVVGRPPV